MHRAKATAGSLAFLLVAPGVVAGLVPWALTGWDAAEPRPRWALAPIVGWLMLAAGIVFLLEAFARFVVEGRGTPAPVAPTERLVVSGPYRYVRNPMYLAVGAAIVGQALALARGVLFAYAALFFVTVAVFVRWYEEPTLARRFGAEYEAYRDAVPAWRPRLRPWSPERT